MGILLIQIFFKYLRSVRETTLIVLLQFILRTIAHTNKKIKYCVHAKVNYIFKCNLEQSNYICTCMLILEAFWWFHLLIFRKHWPGFHGFGTTQRQQHPKHWRVSCLHKNILMTVWLMLIKESGISISLTVNDFISIIAFRIFKIQRFQSLDSIWMCKW